MNAQNRYQRPLAKMPIPIQVGRVNIEGLDEGVRHLGRNVIHAVRRQAPLPSHLKPEVGDQPLVVQIATLWKTYAGFSGRNKPKADNRDELRRLHDIAGFYDELAAAGCTLKQVDGLRERHAKILLQRWLDLGRKPATIRRNWSILRTWCLALSKPGMVGPLEQYWPDAPKPEVGEGGKGERTQDKTLDESQITELMRADDQTHWFVERLHRELGLSVEEALLFDRDMAANYLQGRLMVVAANRRDHRTVNLDSQDKVLLVQQVQAFVTERARARLMWPDMPLVKALRKHQNRVAYLRRKSPGGDHAA